MEKLTIEMLAPYLTYGLQLELDTQTQLGITKRTFELDCGHDFHFYLQQGLVTPLLRPMSEFTVQSEAYKEMAKYLMNLHADTNIANWTMYLDSMKHSSYKDLHYWQIQILAKHHFDFQNLIQKGLAISIHDNLKEK